MAKNSAELNALAQQLRSTRLGVNLTKQLFTAPEGINPREVVKILNAMGANLPSELNWTVDALQIYLSGSAVIDGVKSAVALKEAYQTAKNLGDLQQIKSASEAMNSNVNATAAGLNVLTSFAQKNLGLSDDYASIIRIGTDIGMIVASCGANVQAWVSLATNLFSVHVTKQSLADYRAFENAVNLQTATITNQSKLLTDNFARYQNGEINTYNLIVKAAMESPHLWPQLVNPESETGKVFLDMFPGLSMLPVVESSFTGRGKAEITGRIPFDGKYVLASWSSKYDIPTVRLQHSDKETMAEYFFAALLKPWIINYSIANRDIVERGNMSMSSIAILSYLFDENSAIISDTDDYVEKLIGSMLTPYDFNDPILDTLGYDYLKENYKEEQRTFKQSAVSFGYSNKDFSAYNAGVLDMYKRIEAVKKSYKIEDLVSNPVIYKRLKSYMDFEPTSFEKNPELFFKVSHLNTDVRKIRAWREIGNYFSVLNMLEQFRTDPYLSQTKFVAELMPFMPSFSIFEEKMRYIQQLSYGRLVNELALLRIAEYTGIEKDKLVKVTDDPNYQGASKFTSK